MSESLFVRANGLRFHALAAGSGDRLALCLHGFPELGYSWRHQLPLLAELGYRAWAPDLRGYGRSDRPRRTADYAIEHLLDDVEGLIDAAGVRQATILGHDWGGLIAWYFAMRRPHRLERLVMMNMPHPGPLKRELRKPGQLARFSYVGLFQLPALPEHLLSQNDYHRIDAAFLSQAVDRSRFTPEVLRTYREAAAQPGALTAMLAYYRAWVRGGGQRRQARLGLPVIETPTLLVWGERDSVLRPPTTEGTERWVPNLIRRFIPYASHWVQQEAPETVNAMVAAFLRGERVPEAAEIDAVGSSHAVGYNQRA